MGFFQYHHEFHFRFSSQEMEDLIFSLSGVRLKFLRYDITN